MGEPIKKVNLDDILREKVERSHFTYSEDNWNKLNIELTKQREKRSPLLGVILVLKNRWVQSGLVAAVAVFATYFYMVTVNGAATNGQPMVQTAPVEDAYKNTPEINAVTPPSNKNVTADGTTTDNNNGGNKNTMLAGTDQNERPNKADKQGIEKHPVNENTPKDVIPVLKQQNDEKVAPIIPIEPMEMRRIELVDNDPIEHRVQPLPILAPDTISKKPADKFKVFALEGIGIKAGTSIAPAYEGAPTRTASGTTMGLFSSFALTPKLSIQVEVLYTQVKGHSIQRLETNGETVYTDNGVGTYKYSERFTDINGLNYFRFPVILKYKLTDKLSVGAGGYYSRLESPIGREQEVQYNDVPVKSGVGGYVTNGVYSVPEPDATNSNSSGAVPSQASGLRQYDAGLVFDAEYRIKRWSVGARFNQGITDITPDDIYKVNKIHKTNTTTEITIGFLF